MTKPKSKKPELTKEELDQQRKDDFKDIVIVEAARAATSTIVGIFFSVVIGLLIDHKKK